MRMLSDADLAHLLDKDIFHKISLAADSLHLETYVVGGYVRDLFLERPSNDIDVVVVGSGIEVAKAFKRELGHGAHLSVFRNFGTAQVKWHDHEVESARKATATTVASLMLRTARWKMIRTDVTLQSMLLPFVSTKSALVSSSILLMAFMI